MKYSTSFLTFLTISLSTSISSKSSLAAVCLFFLTLHWDLFALPSNIACLLLDRACLFFDPDVFLESFLALQSGSKQKLIMNPPAVIKSKGNTVIELKYEYKQTS